MYDQPEATCSMEHEAFGLWLTEEISNNHQRLNTVLQALDQIHSKQRRKADINGRYYHLRLTAEDAIVRATHSEFMEQPLNEASLEPAFPIEPQDALSDEDHLVFIDEDAPFNDDIDAEELALDDQQGSAMCGLEDFHAMLLQWQAFVQSR
jgi:uncharacterized protein YacL (UPF0231 family)